MNAHIEILEHPGQEQPWHNRIVGANGEPTWSTETFTREDTARESIVALGRMFSPVGKATVTEFELVVWLDEDEMGAKLVVPLQTITAGKKYAVGGVVKGGTQLPLEYVRDRGYVIPRDVIARPVLIKVADEAERIARIGAMRGRDVSPEDREWWQAEPQIQLRTAMLAPTVAARILGVANWLYARAGGRKP